MTYSNVTGYPFGSDKAAGYGPEPATKSSGETQATGEKILYCVESTDYGNLWKPETGGVFAVSDRAVDFPTDTDAMEAAIEYARTVGSHVLRTRVVRKSEQIVFYSASESEG